MAENPNLGPRWNAMARDQQREPAPPREVDHALMRLATANGGADWRTFMSFYRELIDSRSVVPSDPNAGALLLTEGARRLHREISKHAERASNVRKRRPDQHE